MKQRYILDWSWFIFRAYHGLSELNDAQGNNINAIYGFVRMMMRLMSDWPESFVICRDSPYPSIRKQSFDAYKANRPPLVDNFKRQIGQIKQCVSKLCIPSLEIAWYEADDLIATVINQFGADSSIHFTIVTWDKDLKQLISPQVTCYDQMKWVKTDPSWFVTQYGFDVSYFIEYLSLLWDNADNIPWVYGIWTKGAQFLINAYGTLENIYSHIDLISPTMREKLINGKISAYNSRDLIKLYCAPDIISDPAYYHMNVDYTLLYDVLVHQYNMKSLDKSIDELKKKLAAPKQISLFGP
jgi:DNA polymerase-1